MKPKLVFLAILIICLARSFSFAEPISDLTIISYMGADNDLAAALASDLEEMKQATIKNGVSVVYVYDGPQNAYSGVISSDRKTANLISDFNSADPRELAKFILAATKVKPARKYMLIISDHGRGWKSYYPDINERKFHKQYIKPQSILIDLKSKNEMSLLSLGKALEFVKNQGVNFEVIAFDACLMAMAEVVYQISPYTKYVIASETAALGRGWNYKDFLTKLSSLDGESIKSGRLYRIKCSRSKANKYIITISQ
jgi:hypothetical protein